MQSIIIILCTTNPFSRIFSTIYYILSGTFTPVDSGLHWRPSVEFNVWALLEDWLVVWLTAIYEGKVTFTINSLQCGFSISTTSTSFVVEGFTGIFTFHTWFWGSLSAEWRMSWAALSITTYPKLLHNPKILWVKINSVHKGKRTNWGTSTYWSKTDKPLQPISSSPKCYQVSPLFHMLWFGLAFKKIR